jgi:subtilisin family serine protease
MRCPRALTASLISFLAAAAVPTVLAVEQGETITTTYGGHPLVIDLPRFDPAAVGNIGLRGIQTRDSRLQGDIAIELVAGGDAAALAGEYGLVVQRQHGAIAILAAPLGGDPSAALRSLAALASDLRVRWSEPVLNQPHRVRVVPTDPRYSEQWQFHGTALNLEAAWDTATGSGVRIGIVDSGVKVSHEDLAANCVAGWDLLDDDSDPSPTSLSANHGTGVAGAAAAAKNSVGGVGVAFGASIVPLRLIDTGQTSAKTADALGWGLSGHIPTGSGAVEVAISSNSWGPGDDGIDHGAAADNPSSLELDALATATSSGRGGKGTIFVWACGNGGSTNTAVTDSCDTCDRDGYASNRHVIAVGSTNFSYQRSNYSERGACLFISAPVGDNIATGTGKDGGLLVPDYSSLLAGSTHDTYAQELGTSFAAPMVSGVIALMLQANPNLTWRDVRHILAQTATKDLPSDANWISNGAGLHWNLNYGFGEINAANAVTAALTWTNVPAEATPLTVSATPNLAIPDPGVTAAVPLTISADPKFRAEWVELTVDCQHAYQGDLSFTLTSPRGTGVNFLARPKDSTAARVWTYTSVATWGEWPDGTWTVTARDVAAPDSGTFKNVSLKVYGYLASSASAPGTATASGSSAIYSAGPETTSGTTTSGSTTSGTTGGTGTSNSSGGGGCGLGGGGLAMTGLLGLLAAAWRRQRAA